MKVAVTGGAGFIGSNLVRKLVAIRPDWRIVVLDLLTYAGNIEDISDLLDAGKVAFEKIDITDRHALSALFEREKFEFIFHLAAESHVDRSILGADAFVRTNVLGTQVLIDCARATGCKRFVHISTDEVYGSLGPSGKFFETTPLDPTSPYAASKAASDLMVLAAVKTHKFPAIVTRCTNNYGPYQFPEKFIPLFVTNAVESKDLPLYGDGRNIRSWIHVSDHCDGLIAVAERGRVGEVYNIGADSDGERENIEVAHKILDILGKPKSLIKLVGDRPAHDRRYAVDCSKIAAELGWRPRISFEDGIKETITWYLKNREWWSAVKSGEYLQFYSKNYAHR